MHSSVIHQTPSSLEFICEAKFMILLEQLQSLLMERCWRSIHSTKGAVFAVLSFFFFFFTLLQKIERVTCMGVLYYFTSLESGLLNGTERNITVLKGEAFGNVLTPEDSSPTPIAYWFKWTNFWQNRVLKLLGLELQYLFTNSYKAVRAISQERLRCLWKNLRSQNICCSSSLDFFFCRFASSL